MAMIMVLLMVNVSGLINLLLLVVLSGITSFSRDTSSTTLLSSMRHSSPLHPLSTSFSDSLSSGCVSSTRSTETSCTETTRCTRQTCLKRCPLQQPSVLLWALCCGSRQRMVILTSPGGLVSK